MAAREADGAAGLAVDGVGEADALHFLEDAFDAFAELVSDA
jgi:hypothetical protein